MKSIASLVAVLVLAITLSSQAQTTKPAKKLTIPKNNSFRFRAEEYLKDEKIKDKSEINECRKTANELDKIILDYVNKNNVSEEIANQMWSGEVKPGMPVEGIKAYSNLNLISESKEVQCYRAYIWGPRPVDPNVPYDWIFTVSNGEVIEVNARPKRGQP